MLRNSKGYREVEGFYEWKITDRGKQPMRITIRNGEPYAFAGLFDTWTRPEGQKNMYLTVLRK
ncbi:SOS response-associated peptidase family protein [Brevibacillus borstelensis]|uniref:SOS response-associated peptidase family protein n=1 Tax=Brevibacillus sp. FSL K6-2834 TaxID=2954680 RepID=UPI001D14C4B7|nr:SOS response-associated peptidase family protein [Brevibacillus borstelensis]